MTRTATAVDRTTARLVLTDDQLEFRRVLDTVLDDPRTGGGADDHPRPQDRLAGLGVPGLGVPEEHAGAGAGAVEMSLVAEAVGAYLVAEPFLSTVLAVELLLALGDDGANARYLPLIARGALIATVALDLDLRGAPAPIRVDRTPGGDVVLTGVTGPVLDAPAAGLIICLAVDGAVLSAFAVDPLAPGVTIETFETLDLHRSFGRVRLDGAPATALSGDAVAATARATTRGAVAVAAEQLGIMRRTLQVTTDYARVREQFGRPVASFQAVKHGLADLLIRCELAESLVRYAAWALEHDEPQSAFAVSLAKSYGNDACLDAVHAMIRYHGGIGYTWEHVAHRYYRRAYSDAVLFGSTGWHHERLGRLLHLQSPTEGSR